MENIIDRESTLYLSPYSQSPMDDAEKVTILNGSHPGSTPQEPLALVAKMSYMSYSVRSALKSDGRVPANAAEPHTPSEIPGRYGTSIQHSPTSLFQTSQLLRKVYYQLYADGYEMPSRVANDPMEPSVGRIRADSIPPPHTPTSIKLCISRVEGKPEFVNSDLFVDTTSDSPLQDGHISILHSDGPGLSPDEPMSIVQADVQGESPLPVEVTSIPEGNYLIKNRGGDIYWSLWTPDEAIKKVRFYSTTSGIAELKTKYDIMQVKKFSPNIPVLQRLILFQSGISHILIVTSS